VVDWTKARDEVVMQLRRLIQFQTVNPPGDEALLAIYLQSVLEEAGIAAQIVETAPGRGAVIGTIKGTGALRPVMLLAHTDVVSVEPEHWTTDPFGGEVRDGYVYGRGAIDDKGMLAVNLVTMLLLKRELDATGATLPRDIVFLATPDEEAGGSYGIYWLAEHRPELLDVEYAVNEGGRIRIAADGSRAMLLQTAEKISHMVTITAHGHAGHSGVPRADNSILRLGRALARISEYASDPVHGVSPTILRGGSKFNVIPAEASVQCNVRTRPGESVDHVADELRRLIDDADVTVTVTERGHEAPGSPEDGALYQALAETALALDPTLTVTPYLSNGITDSARLRRNGVKAYGILPFPLIAEDEGRMHGHDERVPVESLVFGLRLIFGAVRKVASGG